MQRILGRVTVATIGGLLALGMAAGPVGADAAIGVDTGFVLGGNSLDAGFEQVLQSALDTQVVGVDVAIVHGHIVLSGYATPGVQTAVLAMLANLLQNPIPVPAQIGIVTPSLGLNLPFFDTGASIELPDLSGLLPVLGVVDHLRIAR